MSRALRSRSACSMGAERDALVNLWAVRRLARDQGVSRQAFLAAYRQSFQLAVARLVQALYRERLCTCRVITRGAAGTVIAFGKPAVLTVPVRSRPFVRLEIDTWPPCHARGQRPVEWSGAFLRHFATALARSPLEPLQSGLLRDFRNSLANLVLNLLLGTRPGVKRGAPEPAFQGHHYYPLPALRIGPSIPQIVACSHLRPEAVDVPLLEVGALSFRSAVFPDARACFAAWSGRRSRFAGHAIPVHPWQLAISPVVQALIEAGGARVLRARVPCRVLASQRTFRVAATGYDIKLAVDASVTSEHRLLHRLNIENAPSVSALVQRLLASMPDSVPFDIQPDVASLSFADAGIAPHLSAIARAPVRTQRGEKAIPAIDLWTGRELALALLRGARRDQINAFCRAYARIMMWGPVLLALRFGLAFEPHLQNSIIVMRKGLPARLVLRDLDGTMMDAATVAPLAREHGVELAADTWTHMPSAAVGEHRLVHALFFAHLGLVVDFLASRCGGRTEELLGILGQEWQALPARAGLPRKGRFDALHSHLDRGKSMLLARLTKTVDVPYVALPRGLPGPTLFRRG